MLCRREGDAGEQSMEEEMNDILANLGTSSKSLGLLQEVAVELIGIR